MECLPIAQPAEEATWQQAQLRDQRRKKKLETNFNRRRGARDLRQLQPGDRVRIKTEKETSWSEPATVLEKLSRRSYLVELKGARYRRNRRHLMLVSPFQVQRSDCPVYRAPAPDVAGSRQRAFSGGHTGVAMHPQLRASTPVPVAPRTPPAASAKPRVAAPPPRPWVPPDEPSFEPTTSPPPPSTTAATPHSSSQAPKVRGPAALRLKTSVRARPVADSS